MSFFSMVTSRLQNIDITRVKSAYKENYAGQTSSFINDGLTLFEYFTTLYNRIKFIMTMHNMGATSEFTIPLPKHKRLEGRKLKHNI